jgi:hypothetical protein
VTIPLVDYRSQEADDVIGRDYLAGGNALHEDLAKLGSLS